MKKRTCRRCDPANR